MDNPFIIITRYSYKHSNIVVSSLLSKILVIIATTLLDNVILMTFRLSTSLASIYKYIILLLNCSSN